MHFTWTLTHRYLRNPIVIELFRGHSDNFFTTWGIPSLWRHSKDSPSILCTDTAGIASCYSRQFHIPMRIYGIKLGFHLYWHGYGRYGCRSGCGYGIRKVVCRCPIYTEWHTRICSFLNEYSDIVEIKHMQYQTTAVFHIIL